ncbi:hypothetical protein [Streptomyces sp. NPDC085529]|uniref:hypothetical protein n=1 Tax=Streptomyces sp. NPDC085529 TaxID=3365729 RepID=UPI0037D04DEB
MVRAQLALAEGEIASRPGTVVVVPPGCPHTLGSRTATPAGMFLHSSPPPGDERHFEELMDLLSADGPPDHAAVADLRRRCGSKRLTPSHHDRPAGRR